VGMMSTGDAAAAAPYTHGELHMMRLCCWTRRQFQISPSAIPREVPAPGRAHQHGAKCVGSTHFIAGRILAEPFITKFVSQ